jgi:endonuclease/exonuclease/phosphatase family metal-dependent hydrolase
MSIEPTKRILVMLCMAICIAFPAVGEDLRVVSMNAWSGLTYRGVFTVGEYEEPAARDFRFELLTRKLVELEPDIVGLNEANPLPGFARETAAALQYAFVYHVRAGGVRVGPVGLPTNLREGDVVLARERHNLLDLGTTRLTGGPVGNLASLQFSQGSQVTATAVSIADRTVHVFLTHWHGSHFASEEHLTTLAQMYARQELTGREYAEMVREAVRGKEKRLEQARETLVFINQIAGHQPAILMGTLNALPESEEIALLKEAGFRDVWDEGGRGAGFTWDPDTNSNIIRFGPADGRTRRRRVDYIFVRGDAIRTSSASVVLDDPTFGIHPSDHYGVMADLTVTDSSAE